MTRLTRWRLVPADRAREPVSKREAIAAAKLKVVLDRQKGKETEPWVLELANEKS
jgi:hypothetical protein